LTPLLDLVEGDKAEDQPKNGPDEAKPTRQRADQGCGGHRVDTGPLHWPVTRRFSRQGSLLHREAHTLLRVLEGRRIVVAGREALGATGGLGGDGGSLMPRSQPTRAARSWARVCRRAGIMSPRFPPAAPCPSA